MRLVSYLAGGREARCDSYVRIAAQVRRQLVVLQEKKGAVLHLPLAFASAVGQANERLDSVDVCYYVYSLDAMSNMVGLCAPMLCKDGSAVEYEWQAYDEALTKKEISLMLIELDEFQGLSFVDPQVKPLS